MKDRYFGRDGTAYNDVLEWANDFHKNKIIEQTELPDGKWVSTVWLGLDYKFGEGPPLIFETMVFPKHGEWNELDCQRYSTEAGAIQGHRAMCEKWNKTRQ